MTEMSAVQVRAETRGAVPPDMVDFTVRRIGSLLHAAPAPVLSAGAKLIMIAIPSVARPAIAQLSVNLNGWVLRAQAADRTMTLAVEHACDRLRIRLDRAARNWEATRGRRPVPEAGEWRHDSVPTPPLPYFPRPVAERVILRRKSYALARETVAEAVADADLMDYDFHLFTEQSTGEDGVVYRSKGGYRLALANPEASQLFPVAAPVTVSETPAPRLSVSEATTRLELAGQAFLFFVNTDTNRGNLLYHRYDGHYGLIAPAE